MESRHSLKASTPSNPCSTPAKRDAWLMEKILTGEMLKPGAPVMNPRALDMLLDLYSELCDEIGEQRFEAAYAFVLKTSKFRPDIAEIRAAAGAVPVAPIEAEAMAALGAVFVAMRRHGPELPAIPGKLLADRTPEGGYLARHEWVWGEAVPACVFGDLPEAAIAAYGFGDRPAGLAMLAGHPAVCHPVPGEDRAGSPAFLARNAAEIERRWLRTYSICKARKEQEGSRA